MKKVLDIFTIQRSGHHAIINWLCESNRPSIHIESDVKKDKSYAILYKRFWGKKRINYNDYIELIEKKKLNLIIRNYVENVNVNKVKRKNKSIIILREPRNLFASRIKSNLKTHGIEKLWIEHACKEDRYYKILYDEWFTSKVYRKKICKDLGLNFKDKGLNEIFMHGKSSFDDYEFDGNAQKMDVLNRWQEYKFEISKIVDRNMLIKWEELLHKGKEL